MKKSLSIRRMVVILLALSGCIDSEHDGGCVELGEKVSMQLAAGIENESRAVTDVVTKAPILTTGFPVSGSGVVSNIGLFFMREDGVTPYAVGSSNMLGELTGVTVTPNYRWRYQYAKSTEWMSNLTFYVGERVKLWGYYPHAADIATPIAVPFDLSRVSEQNNQNDILYSPSQTLTVTSFDTNRSVTMGFKHFYALLEFMIKKEGTQAAVFTSVTVNNRVSKGWIRNKGTFNASTGAINDDVTIGSVSVNYTAGNVLQTNTYTTFHVMVPPLSGAFEDGDIEIQFYDNGVAKPSKFLLKSKYLTDKGAGNYALMSGGRYAFNLLYSAKGELSVVGWDNGGEMSGSVGTSSYPIMEYGVAPHGIIKGDVIYGAKTSGTYNNYYGEGTVTNGIMSVDIKEIFKNEPPYYKLAIAREDIFDSTTTWKVYRDVVVSMGDICKKKMGGDWRMPRLAEIRMLLLNSNSFIGIYDGFTPLAISNYWSATERELDYAWCPYTTYTEDISAMVKWKIGNPIRCVREVR